MSFKPRKVKAEKVIGFVIVQGMVLPCENKEDKEILFSNGQLYGRGLRKDYYYIAEGEYPQYVNGKGPIKYRTILRLVMSHLIENFSYLTKTFSIEATEYLYEILKQKNKDAIYLSIDDIKKLLKGKIFRKKKR
jgi:hypothetical protein